MACFAALGCGFVALGESRRRLALLAALLGFAGRSSRAVEVDAARAGGAVGVVERDAVLEDVGVVRVVRLGRVGPRDAEQVAQLGEEELVVRTLRRAGGGPAGDEGVDVIRACDGVWFLWGKNRSTSLFVPCPYAALHFIIRDYPILAYVFQSAGYHAFEGEFAHDLFVTGIVRLCLDDFSHFFFDSRHDDVL